MRNSVATLSTSLSMLSRTPGYWILMAMSRPSRACARCTCPIEAAAMGVYEKCLNCFSQPLPHWASSTPFTWALGMARASERRRARISASAGGSRSPDSIETSCPTFIAAPRSLASWSATRRALAGVSSRSLILGRLPWASWRAPSAIMPPAMPVAIQPRRASREPRPLGTARVGAADLGAGGCYLPASGCPWFVPASTWLSRPGQTAAGAAFIRGRMRALSTARSLQQEMISYAQNPEMDRARACWR